MCIWYFTKCVFDGIQTVCFLVEGTGILIETTLAYNLKLAANVSDHDSP